MSFVGCTVQLSTQFKILFLELFKLVSHHRKQLFSLFMKSSKGKSINHSSKILLYFSCLTIMKRKTMFQGVFCTKVTSEGLRIDLRLKSLQSFLQQFLQYHSAHKVYKLIRRDLNLIIGFIWLKGLNLKLKKVKERVKLKSNRFK